MSKTKLNQPKLSKMLRKEKDLWITKKGDSLYIISPTYIIKTQEEIKGRLLTTLLKVFGQLPNNEEVLNTNRKLDVDQAIKTAYENVKNDLYNVELIDTKLLEERKDGIQNWTLRILANNKASTYIKLDNEKIFIDNPKSFHFIDNPKNFQGYSPINPVYIEGDKSDMTLFPVKCEDNDFLKRLL